MLRKHVSPSYAVSQGSKSNVRVDIPQPNVAELLGFDQRMNTVPLSNFYLSLLHQMDIDQKSFADSTGIFFRSDRLKRMYALPRIREKVVLVTGCPQVVV